ncbi:lipocalin family protein [Ornithobacterium rhinotracheale]|uniref:Lipocalin-like domain-containing protein n=1 Tax=Ornithobacterium rhinotracheale (strain ATCC 51463 / DSM 15997 / CCUG 23171 / CIP 104009 / LMG 9086) TaxID=867902 RepID=I4A311_ORNRL|nr:lipocalin family protein [Ornithobacterium rhinotracheale]AFL98345.1 hypothetical protein Ornrh_2214 [Ornithobacterium rhinotracheale DSM 15997]AIQ00726.1 hypothetical protein Q785_11200 [Ornithobacterium rhinotracheale ORT-UMN 88]KGB65805.1 hypothetical protein Q787_10725 [Ornithobacterium rhinotracheale H06-030791]MCK0193308.1 lipocalin family protein [Ornithobacterium rhinotracheale]MCK0201699.1 lipocalin family protein [Ornithobacterium rhinotracheale]
MKKLIIPAMLCSLLAVSCSKDDDNGNKPVVEPPIEKFESLIVGKWKPTAIQIVKSSDGEVVDLGLSSSNECNSKDFNQYTKDGKYIENKYFEQEDSADCKEQVSETTYTIDQLKSTLEIKGLLNPVEQIIKLNREELVLKVLGADYDKDDKADYRIYTYKRIDK